jgi:pimeloyl-ACP methyl ester carboxylesterase
VGGRPVVTEGPTAASGPSPGADPSPRLVRSADGSEVAVRSAGSGAATPILFCNAVGATLALWRTPLAQLARGRRWVTWDLRGLHDSPAPVSDRLDPATQAADGIAAIDALGIADFALVSWSNGSRVAFDVAASHPGRVRALVVVNGGQGQSLARLLRNLEPGAALPLLAGVAKHFPQGVGLALRQLVSRPELAGLIRQSGILGRSVDPAPVIEMLRGLAACDTRRLLATFEAIAGNSAAELLPSIQAPTLFIAGGSDRFSRPRVVQEMQDLIPGARVHTYENAGHYLPLESSERLADDISEFLSGTEGALR